MPLRPSPRLSPTLPQSRIPPPSPTRPPCAGHNFIPTPAFTEEEDQKVLDLFKGLRVADVVDGMDAVGLQDIGLMSPQIGPLWRDTEHYAHRICGIAVTARYVPANKPPAGLRPEAEFDKWVDQWYQEIAPETFAEILRKGTVVVIDGAEGADVGPVGSNNILGWKLKGCVGVVTNTTARDTDEIAAEKVPLYYRHPGRGIRPGRIELESVNRPVACGGALVVPGDVIVADGNTFDLRLFRGYGVRKFWDETIGSRNRKAGVDRSADTLNANEFDAKGYDRTDPGSDSDYGNLDRDAAIQEWEDKLALVEISTHASTGHIGWYVGTYNTGEGAVAGKEQELYDSAHRQSYYATDRITDQDLDDVFVFIAGGCDTYGEPEKEGMESIPTVLKNRGVDVVFSWDKSQYPARHLWVKYFLEMSFVKVAGAYPTMEAAAVSARDELVDDFDQETANYVYDNLKWDGKVANPQNQKLFPPRYGRKDN